MSVMITGATGFIGKYVSVLIKDKVRVVRRESDVLSHNDIVIDSLDKNTCWKGMFDGVDAIIHLAGAAHSTSYSEDDYFSINTHGTLNLAHQAQKAGVKRFVFVSSIGVNGLNTKQKPFSANDKVNPHNPYARSKLEAEVGLKKLAADTGMEVVIVRPTLVYGPQAPGNFNRLTELVCRLPVLPFGLIHNRRDFIAVQNLADLLVNCTGNSKASGHTFLASDGDTVSIKEFTEAIAGGVGKRLIQLPVPENLMRWVGLLTGKSAMIDQLIGNLEVDSTSVRRVLDWEPPLTMQQAMASLRNSGMKEK